MNESEQVWLTWVRCVAVGVANGFGFLIAWTMASAASHLLTGQPIIFWMMR